MQSYTILAIARKDALDILINKTAQALLITPIALSILFAFISSVLSTHTSSILVYNPGHSTIVQAVTGTFTNSQVTQANSPDDVAAAFGRNGSRESSPYAVGVIVPADFDTSLRRGGHPPLSLYMNGDDLNNMDGQAILNAVANYTRSTANPQPPASITVATINPPSSFNVSGVISKAYVMTALLVSFLTGISLVSGLLVEEKEKKTLRMLMVSPASFTDVVLGKLLVGLGYQLLLSLLVLVIQGGFVGQVPVTLLFILLGSCFSLLLGLLFGSIVQSSGASGAVCGLVSFIYIIPAIFVGVLDALLQNSTIEQIIKVLPTYYLADGIFNAVQNSATLSVTVLDGGVVLGCIIVLLLLSITILRRQAALAGAI